MALMCGTDYSTEGEPVETWGRTKMRISQDASRLNNQAVRDLCGICRKG